MSRRYVAVGAVAAAALLAGTANAGAEPASDTSDRRGVGVEYSQPAKRAAVEPIPSAYVPVTPQRVLDTRNGGGPVAQGGTTTVNLSTSLPTTATAVVLNVTGTAPTANTFITVHPGSEARPNASSLNLVPGQTRANQVTIGLNPDRTVALYNNAGSTHLIADIAGYYVDDWASLYNAVQPGRVLDTRAGGPVGQGGTVDITFGWLPDTATSVTFNLTAVSATANTFVTAFSAGQSLPLASNLNIGPGETVPNQVTVPLGANKSVRLFNGNGSVHLIADMVGYYATDHGDWFAPFDIDRAVDTRDLHNGLTPDMYLALLGFGTGQEEVALTTVVGNLTGTNPTASGYVVAYPSGDDIPFASNLNLVPGQTAANAITVGIGFDTYFDRRGISFANSAGYVDIIVDITGYFVRYNG